MNFLDELDKKDPEYERPEHDIYEGEQEIVRLPTIEPFNLNDYHLDLRESNSDL